MRGRIYTKKLKKPWLGVNMAVVDDVYRCFLFVCLFVVVSLPFIYFDLAKERRVYVYVGRRKKEIK